jgi:REP element-mobilizing transposase RayT
VGRFKDQYRIESTRLQTWDYSQPGLYFVTICTHGRRPYFGRIVDYQLQPSAAGLIVAEEWQRTAELRDAVELDRWTIMPNHLHGILLISFDPDNPTEVVPADRWKSGSLGAMVNQFKGACTKRIRAEVDPSFGWQARFYEHIVRNDHSLDRIRAYIEGNPATWTDDQLFIDTVLT